MSMRAISIVVAVVVATYAVTSFGEPPTASTNRVAANDIPAGDTRTRSTRHPPQVQLASKVEEVMLGSPEFDTPESPAAGR